MQYASKSKLSCFEKFKLLVCNLTNRDLLHRLRVISNRCHIWYKIISVTDLV